MGELSTTLKQTIIEQSKIIGLSKNEKILNEEEKSDRIYFILRGAVRLFYLDNVGVETNTWFLFENELVVSVYSFFTSQLSFENIEILEDSVFIVLKRDKLDWLMNV